MSEDKPTLEEKKDEESDPTEELLDRLPESVTTMWEIPQIYEFLCLAKSSLHIQHLSMYEMERMLLIPRASKQLAIIMTSLLSPSLPRSKLKKVPLMPYEFWTNYLLAHKVSQWYKVYQSKEYDSVKVFDTIGVEPEFWEIFPEVASMGVRDFEDFTLRQRVWLLKTVCDTLTHSRKSLQEEVSNRYLNGESEKLLGRDRYGTRYIYFPIFLDNDLRIYKHCMNNKVFLNAVPVKAKLKLQNTRVRKKRRDRRRTNRWRNGFLPKRRSGGGKKNSSEFSISENNTNNSNKIIEKNDIAININIHNNCNQIDDSNLDIKEDKYGLKEDDSKAIESLESEILKEEEEEEKEKECESKEEKKEEDKECEGKEEKKEDDKEEKEKDSQVKVEENEVVPKIDEKRPENDEYNECTVRDDVSSSSKTDDEKINEMLSSTVNITKENNCSGSKSDDEKLIETQTQVVSDNQVDNEVTENIDADLKDQREEIGERNDDDDDDDDNDKKESNEEMDDSKLMEDNLCHDGIDDENKMEITEGCKRDMENFNNILTDLKGSKFQLVADSIDSLRNLIADLYALNSVKSTQPVRCEMLLISKLQALLDTLKSKESMLKESADKSRAKLLSEQKNFIEGLPELDDSLIGTRNSNSWVLGSQGCPLLSYSDTILQRLFQEDDSEREKMKIKEEIDNDESDHDSKEEPETRRVLRARGVSSYIEPFSSDSESASSSYEDWVGFESVDPATGIHSAPAPLPVPAKARLTTDQSDATDSDKDWILPSRRKRKRKGSSPSKRLRSQSNKSQTTKADFKEPEMTPEPVVDPVPDPVSTTPDPDPIISNNGLLNSIKIESVHSVLDIKDEGPIMDSQPEPVSAGMHQNYVLVNAGNGPVNYVVMPPENPSIVPQSPMISVIPQVPMHSGYYMHNPPGYLIPNQPMSNHMHSYGEPSNLQMNNHQHMIIQQNPNYIPPHNNYMPYHQMRAPMYSNRYQGPIMNQPGMNQRGINQPVINQPRVNQPGMERPLPRVVQNRPITLPPRPRHPDGAVIRSTVPFRPTYRPVAAPTLRARLTAPRHPNQQQNVRHIQPRPNLQKSNQPKAKTTSLIVLSDSDDEIEMIITEKAGSTNATTPQKQGPKNTVQKKVINRTGNIDSNSGSAPKANTATKSGLTPQIIERMNQGGISITPVKPKSPAKTSPISATQLVVVVNETGSHYALALPNGSKLILTPEQVAQIRASNGGKLIL
ncbi:uncharacterized protein LOC123271804 isoform X2 [Cotesia glomerata]|nr:uncharacterized protein LOC123271804 isoform X2 [Cotesia glomerata]XP_044594158.1 uncharacterized protein LOC123271804 isoform X2 [Cotesia glomerata]XP_044594159.1 uncharacterized protein LOC123271804 isoform X2 [Cotesia glomerata]XP_044594160.1 uncharacterized protein LOC123271804 isoform X2 [Cotesia glomerata]